MRFLYLLFMFSCLLLLVSCTQKCELINWQGDFCVDDLPDFPEQIGVYELEDYSKVNWEDNCDVIGEDEFCIRSIRFSYYDAQANIAIHVMPRYVLSGDESIIEGLVINEYAADEVAPGVYRLLEEHELFWASENEFNHIMTQEYSYESNADGGRKSIFRKANQDNEVVQYFLGLYPAKELVS